MKLGNNSDLEIIFQHINRDLINVRQEDRRDSGEQVRRSRMVSHQVLKLQQAMLQLLKRIQYDHTNVIYGKGQKSS